MRLGKKGWWGSHEVTVDTGRGMGDAGPCNNAAERTLRTTHPHSMIHTPEKRKREKKKNCTHIIGTVGDNISCTSLYIYVCVSH